MRSVCKHPDARSGSRPRVSTAVILACGIVFGAIGPQFAFAQATPLPSATVAGDESFAHSANIVRDRNLQSLLTAGRQSIGRGEFASGFSSLQEILNSKTASFQFDGNGEHPDLRHAVNELIASLPVAERERYAAQFASRAGQALDAARKSRSTDALIEVATAWYHTSAGRQALHEHAFLLFDRGEFHSAAAAFRGVLEHPLTDAESRASVLSALSFALLQTGKPQEIDALLASHAAFAQRSVQIAGQTSTWQDWLKSQRPPVNPISPAGGPGNVFAHLPSTLAAWSQETGPPSAIAELLSESLSETDAQGVFRLSPFRPIASTERGTIVIRTLDDIVACEVAGGRMVWRTQTGAQSSRLAGNPKSLQNESFQELMSEQLLRRTQADDILGTLTFDRARVYAVVEPEEPDRSQSNMPMRTNVFAADASAVGNELAALDFNSGRILWRLHGADVAKDAQRVVFRGPPLVLGQKLYNVVQVDREFRLIVASAVEGRLLHSIPLAEAVESKAEQRKPRETACPVVEAQGLLLCPTGLGVLVAVDLATHRPAWAFRYERDDIRPTQGLPPGRWSRKSYEAWWMGWRSLGLVVSGNRVLLASPEADAIFALDLKTGKKLWKQPRRNGLLLAGAAEERVLIVEPQHVRALDAHDGGEVWAADAGTPAGRGVFSSGWYIQPSADGNFAAITIRDGAIQRTPVGDRLPLGNLVAAGDCIVSQSFDRLTRFKSIAVLSAEVEDKLKTSEDDAALQRRLAHLQREAGDWTKAAAAFEQLQSAPGADAETMRSELRQTLLASLRHDPESLEQVRPLLETVSAEGAPRIERLLAVFEAQRRLKQPLSALETLLTLIELRPPGERIDARDPHRTVRFDRSLQGLLADLLHEFPEHRSELNALIAGRQQKAEQSPDPFALQRFAENFGGLDWGQRVRTNLSARAGIGVGLLELQLQLLHIGGQGDRQLAANALAQLAKLMQSRSYRREAALAYKRLEAEHPHIVLNDGRTAAEVIAAIPADSPLHAALRDGSGESWPASEPKLTVSESKPRDPVLFRIPIIAEAGTLYDRLSVYVDQSGKKLRFQGDEQRGFWEVNLPVSAGQLRTTSPLHCGWGIGQLLVLRLGSELFGIAALNENGEGRAQVLWRIDTLGDRAPRWSQWEVRVERTLPGFGVDLPAIGDLFGRTIGQVGPVRPGYLCYFDRGDMIAIDPLTAVRLWVRHALPAESVCFGDDEHLYLTRRDSNRVEVLRALDGALLAMHELPADSAAWLTGHGRNIVIPQADQDRLALTQYDLVTGQPGWRREFTARPMLFGLDSTACGVLHAGGQLEVLDVRTGETKHAAHVAQTAAPGRIFTCFDQSRCFVVLSQGFKNEADLKINRERGEGFRSPLVSGRLLAFDRRTSQLLWQTELPDVAFPLDLPREVPFLVLNFWKAGPRTGAANELTSVVQVLDKRNGNQLHELREAALPRSTGAVWLETNIDQFQADVRTELHTLRFEFGK